MFTSDSLDSFEQNKNLYTIIMKRHNIILTFSLVMLFWFSFQPKAGAQVARYSDLYESLDQMTPEQAFYRLSLYQEQNPHFANTYVQLGRVSEQMYREFDPLRDFSVVEYWANNALLYYNVFFAYFEGNEARRNRDYYMNLGIEPAGRRLDNEDIEAYVKKKQTKNKNYLDSLRLVFRALETSKDHYNNCVRIFNDINAQYDNLNEALLQTNPMFLALLKELDDEFKASKDAFSYYKDLLRLFPIEGYNQEFSLRNIETFRLDGLTNSDFLENMFYLSDYSSWVSHYRSLYANDIIPLREEVAGIQRLFDDNLEMLQESETLDDEMELASYDELFLYRLGKYDSNSLIRELFNYLHSRQDFFQLRTNPLDNPADGASELMNRKLRYYYRLAMQLTAGKESLDVFHEAITPERVTRFTDFFESRYGGHDGLFKFYEDQRAFLNNTFNASMDNLSSYLDNERFNRTAISYARSSDGISIPLFPVNRDFFNYDGLVYITRDVFYEQGIPAYAAGYKKTEHAGPVAFVAKLSKDLAVEWIRELSDADGRRPVGGNKAFKVFGFENGVITMVASRMGSIDMLEDPVKRAGLPAKNSLVHINDQGEYVYLRSLAETGIPTFVRHDDINQLTLLASGNQSQRIAGLLYTNSISMADSLGNLLWRAELPVNAQLIDILRAEDKFLAIVNTNEHDDDQRWRAGVVEISFRGEILGITFIPASDDYHVNRTFSISSDEINLLGTSGIPGQTGGDLKYLIVSSDSEVLFDNLE